MSGTLPGAHDGVTATLELPARPEHLAPVRRAIEGVAITTSREPIDHGWPVPWIPTAPLTPIQRALSGLSAAPPATCWPAISPAQGEFGAVQVGLTCLLWIAKRPLGVG